MFFVLLELSRVRRSKRGIVVADEVLWARKLSNFKEFLLN